MKTWVWPWEAMWKPGVAAGDNVIFTGAEIGGYLGFVGSQSSQAIQTPWQGLLISNPKKSSSMIVSTTLELCCSLQLCYSWVGSHLASSFNFTQTKSHLERSNLNWRNASLRLAREHGAEAFLKSPIDVGSPIPLRAMLSLGRWAWAVQDTLLRKQGEASQGATLLYCLCFSPSL